MLIRDVLFLFAAIVGILVAVMLAKALVVIVAADVAFFAIALEVVEVAHALVVTVHTAIRIIDLYTTVFIVLSVSVMTFSSSFSELCLSTEETFCGGGSS